MVNIQIKNAAYMNVARPFVATVNGEPMRNKREYFRMFATESAARRAAEKFAAGIKTEMFELSEIVRKTYSVELFQKYKSAEQNLDGRSFYLTAGAFKTRISAEAVSCMGLVFWIIESSKTSDTTRGFAAVAFDVFGNEIVNTGRYSTADGARKAFWESFNAVNVAAHYKNKMLADVERMQRDMQAIASAAKTINA